MEEMGQRRGGKGMLSWEEVSTFSLGTTCTWAAPVGLQRTPCALSGQCGWHWSQVQSLGPVGLMVSSLSPSLCSLYPPPMNPQACPPPRFSQKPPRDVDTRHWMLSCIRKSLGPWGRRKQEGGWLGEKEAGLSHCTQTPPGSEEEGWSTLSGSHGIECYKRREKCHFVPIRYFSIHFFDELCDYIIIVGHLSTQ